ncbi:MAG: hypothetical protein JJV95_07490 [Sulfurospirillum sp.]|nr:hypothetical protein [Sulfurospirillum sp.]
MIKLSNEKLIAIIMRILIVLALGKSISLVILWYLPSDGVELSLQKNYLPKYKIVDFKNMLTAKTDKITKKKTKKQDNTGIESFILTGLYSTKSRGFIIIALESLPQKTSIIETGETYKGYMLKTILSSSVILSKNDTDFTLKLWDKKTASSPDANVEKEIKTNITRGEIEHYSKNPDKIFKNINLQEVKNGNKITGFKIKNIKQNSVFSNLGLKKDDILIKANNIKLESHKAALQIYKDINNLKSVKITVLRDNQEKELIYEIN